MKKIILFLCMLSSITHFAQKRPASSSLNQVYNLTGAINLQSIRNANPLFVAEIPPTYFNNIDELYLMLQEKGTLKLTNAVLTLNGIPNNKVTLSFHRIELINSEIFINNTNINLVCNEYRQSNSHVHSFTEQDATASNGATGTTPGQNGSPGIEGMNGGNVFVFVTDKIITAPGNIDFDLFGQNGGDGANGIIGAAGATGARGRGCSSGTISCNSGNGPGHDGKNGGKGGDAGNGGNGGDGGKLTFKLHGSAEPSLQHFTFKGENGLGGQPGSPAAGGPGGKGGAPGSKGCGDICKPYTNRSGNNGQTGPSGSIGSTGQDGIAQVLTRGTFNVEFLKDFLTEWNGLSVNKSTKSRDVDVVQSSGLKSIN